MKACLIRWFHYANHYSVNKKITEQPHLGLGLYIARLICQFHQGKITAYNHQSPDGVTIDISLPLKFIR